MAPYISEGTWSASKARAVGSATGGCRAAARKPCRGAERSGRARGAPRARAVDLPPAHFPHMFVNFSSKFEFVLGYNNGTNF